jgi:hypothetical protein
MGFEKQKGVLETEPQKVMVQFLDGKGNASPEGKGEVGVVEVKLGSSGEPVAILKFPEGHAREGEIFEARWNQNEKNWIALPMD